MSVDPKAGYYTRDGIEAVDVLRAFATPEEFRGWCKCEAILHLLRGPWKGDERRDVEKAATLAAWLAGEHQAPPPERSAAVEARHGKSAWETHPETEALDIMAANEMVRRQKRYNVLKNHVHDALVGLQKIEQEYPAANAGYQALRKRIEMVRQTLLEGLESERLWIAESAEMFKKASSSPQESNAEQANNASPAGYCGDGGVCKLLRSTRGAQFCQRGECKEASL